MVDNYIAYIVRTCLLGILAYDDGRLPSIIHGFNKRLVRSFRTTPWIYSPLTFPANRSDVSIVFQQQQTLTSRLL
uniref:Uncharacterized protein n=1 Tax=Megaselia scalaris TaxID=36166 RepID=T1GDN0_MEGSC